MLKILFLCILVGFAQHLFSDEVLDSVSIFPADVIHSIVDAIDLEGDSHQQERIKQWLWQIATVPKGFSTLAAINRSGHKLTIRHSSAARLSAGRTIAPMTNDLINGVGADVTIIFDGDMPDYGSHQVFNAANQLIEFTAVQNLYHELAHAMHQMRGTWRYFASEKQAIEEENYFRYELALQQGRNSQQRYQQAGVLIDDTTSATLANAIIINP